MPKVMLLAEEYEDYTIHFGQGSFDFIGGREVEVPVAVALHCSKQKRDGKCLFSVSDMPDIVECVTPSKPSEAVEQNIVNARHLFSQPKLFESSICL